MLITERSSIRIFFKVSTMNPAAAPKHVSGVMGLPPVPSQHRQAAVSTHELVHKDRQKELDRIIHSSDSHLSADYASYVLLPLIFLVGLLVGVRRLLAL
jgi:hypothetical protein